MTMDDALRDLLTRKVFAHLALTDERGRPHVSPVWVDVRRDRIFINTLEGRIKARLLQPGAPVALSVLDPDDPYRYVLVRGRVAEATFEGGAEGIDALATKYWGHDYTAHDPQRRRINVFIEPERVFFKQ